jgi:hypothetical protein
MIDYLSNAGDPRCRYHFHFLRYSRLHCTGDPSGTYTQWPLPLSTALQTSLHRRSIRYLYSVTTSTFYSIPESTLHRCFYSFEHVILCKGELLLVISILFLWAQLFSEFLTGFLLWSWKWKISYSSTFRILVLQLDLVNQLRFLKVAILSIWYKNNTPASHTKNIKYGTLLPFKFLNVGKV